MLLLSIFSFDLRASHHLEIDCMQAIFLRRGGGGESIVSVLLWESSQERNSTTEKKNNSRNPEVSILPLPKWI